MDYKETRIKVLISMQRALLGMIYPEIRMISVGFNGIKKLTVIYYLDREPNESDYENISEVTASVCADIEFSEVEEICEYLENPYLKVNSLDGWVYIRQEL